jgi:hypothetical protein
MKSSVALAEIKHQAFITSPSVVAAGFGSAVVIPIFFLSTYPYAGASVANSLMPLFIVLACESSPKLYTRKVGRLPRIPVFAAATWTTKMVLGSVARLLLPKMNEESGAVGQQQQQQQQQKAAIATAAGARERKKDD